MQHIFALGFHKLTSCLPRPCQLKAASTTCLAAGGELESSNSAPWIAKGVQKQQL